MADREELERKVADARKAREELAKKRKEEISLRRLEEEAKLVDLELEHGAVGPEIRAVFTDEGAMIVLKRPSQVSFEAFQTRLLGQKVRNQDFEELVLGCLVYPDARAFEKIRERSPGILAKAADAAVELGGLAAEDAASK